MGASSGKSPLLRGFLVTSDVAAKGLLFVGAESILNDNTFRVLKWQPGRFKVQRKLENAGRNQGVVMLMDMDGMPVAVKRMPLAWAQADHASFCKAHAATSENERPWYDIAIMNFLTKEGKTFGCQFHGVFADNMSLYVVSALATGGDLFNWCQTIKVAPSKARELVIKPFAKQIASAVQALHGCGICHRDISLENVLVHYEADGSVCTKLIDFGMSAVSRNYEGEVRGKYAYQAPEMHRGTRAYDGFLSDAFAVGVLVFCLSFGEYPWNTTQPKACKKYDFVEAKGIWIWFKQAKVGTRTHEKETILDVSTPALVAFLLGLLAFDPVSRLTLGEQAWGSRMSVWDTDWMQPEGGTLSRTSTPGNWSACPDEDGWPCSPASSSVGFFLVRT